VLEFAQTWPTPFKHKVPRNYWCYWFKCMNKNLSIKVVKKLEVSKAHGVSNSNSM
jgi:hypothetical protein